jgi:hypothetical protein
MKRRYLVQTPSPSFVDMSKKEKETLKLLKWGFKGDMCIMLFVGVELRIRIPCSFHIAEYGRMLWICVVKLVTVYLDWIRLLCCNENYSTDAVKILKGSDLITFLFSHTSSFLIQSRLLLFFTQKNIISVGPYREEESESFSLTLPLSNILPSSNKKIMLQ